MASGQLDLVVRAYRNRGRPKQMFDPHSTSRTSRRSKCVADRGYGKPELKLDATIGRAATEE
jgi:hypothetical protein